MNILTPSLSQYPPRVSFNSKSLFSVVSGRLLHRYPPCYNVYARGFFLFTPPCAVLCCYSFPSFLTVKSNVYTRATQKKMNDLVARTTSLSLAFCSSVGHFSLTRHSRGFLPPIDGLSPALAPTAPKRKADHCINASREGCWESIHSNYPERFFPSCSRPISEALLLP